MPDTPHTRLLDALSENSLVKAALVIDHAGAVRGQRGHANVLTTEGDTQLQVRPTSAERSRENVYLVEMTEDLLIVVFEENVDFERLRNAVDVLLRHTGLNKPPGSSAPDP